MVGADCIDGAIDQRLTNRITVTLAAQWRGQPRIRIKETNIRVSQMHIVRTDITAHRQPFGFGGTHQLQSGGRRQPAQMHARAGSTHQLEDGMQRNGLTHYWHASQTKPRGQRAAMGDAALAQMRVLRTQPNGIAEGVRILQRAHQHGGVFYRVFGL